MPDRNDAPSLLIRRLKAWGGTGVRAGATSGAALAVAIVGTVLIVGAIRGADDLGEGLIVLGYAVVVGVVVGASAGSLAGGLATGLATWRSRRIPLSRRAANIVGGAAGFLAGAVGSLLYAAVARSLVTAVVGILPTGIAAIVGWHLGPRIEERAGKRTALAADVEGATTQH